MLFHCDILTKLFNNAICRYLGLHVSSNERTMSTLFYTNGKSKLN